MPWKKGNRLHAVREQDASTDIASIYADIMRHLGVPNINVIFQVYASYAHFLPLQWQMLKPVLQSGEFFQLADRLRADAYTRAHNYFDIANLMSRLDALRFSDGAKRELGEVIDLFTYNDPLLLLITAAQQQAFDGPIGSGKAAAVPPAPQNFEKRPVMVDEESAEPEVRKVFEEMKQAFELPVVLHDFSALARWPDFLGIYWEVLQPLLASPLYQQCQYGIHESAWNLARELPGSMELTLEQMTEAGMSEDDVSSVVKLTQAFSRGLSASVLNISIARIGLDGGNHVERAPHKEEMTPTALSTPPNRAA